MPEWRLAYLSISDCRPDPESAVVVDVLRAFTTAAWAFDRGVARIVLAGSLDEALRLKARLPGSLALKDGEPAPGFDLSNSPAEMSRRQDLEGCTLVQCTTAGTVGAVAVREAASLYCASFVCAAATAAAIRAAPPRELTLVVTGDGGQAEEDRACAEYIAALVMGAAPVAAPYLQRARNSLAAARLAQRVKDGLQGFDAADVEMCLQADRFGFAMRARQEDGLLVLRAVSPGSLSMP